MLGSLSIHNYRNLRALTLNRLGRVNLIVGKNNTGKTALLEAVSIHINRGNFSFLLQLLDERGENYVKRNTESVKGNDIIRTVSALFHDRKPRYTEADSIVIGELDNTLFGTALATDTRTSIRFVKFIETYEPSNEDLSRRRRRHFLDENATDIEAQIGLDIRSGQLSILVPLMSSDLITRTYRSPSSYSTSTHPI